MLSQDLHRICNNKNWGRIFLQYTPPAGRKTTMETMHGIYIGNEFLSIAPQCQRRQIVYARPTITGASTVFQKKSSPENWVLHCLGEIEFVFYILI